MNLTPVANSELSVGRPLPWDLFDQLQQPIRPRGAVIDTAEELNSLLKEPLFRLLEEPVPAAIPVPTPGATDQQVRFADMQLRVGDRMQFQPPPKVGVERSIVRVIGYVEDLTLMVTAPKSGQWQAPLMEGDEVVLRIFGGQSAYGFTSHVDRIIKLPFDYLHLEFPKRITGRLIRKSRRIKTNLPVSASGIQRTPGAGTITATISNISATGAEIHADASLGEIGDSFSLSFRIKVHGIETALTPHAEIRSLKQEGDSKTTRYGVEFKMLQTSEALTLQSWIYQEIIEHPDSLI